MIKTTVSVDAFASLFAATFLCLAATPGSSQDHESVGGVSLAFDVRDGGTTTGDLQFVESSAVGDTVFSLYRRVGDQGTGLLTPTYIEARDIPTGNLIWSSDFATQSDLLEKPVAIAALPDSSAVFLLSNFGVNGTGSMALTRFDGLDGTPSLIDTFTGPLMLGNAIGLDLAASPDGTKVYEISAGFFGGDLAIRALDTSTGAELWAAGPSFSGAELIAGDERVYVLADKRIRAHNALDGELLWTTKVGNGTKTRLELSNDESKLALSLTPSGGDPAMGGLFVLDTSNGGLLWKRSETKYSAEFSDSDELVFGVRTLPTDLGIETTAFDSSTGSISWQSQFSSGSTPKAEYLASRTSQGSVSVGMTTTSLAGDDVSAVANYDALTGALLWRQSGNASSDFLLHYNESGTHVVFSGSTPQTVAPGVEVKAASQIGWLAATGGESWKRSSTTLVESSDKLRAFATSPDGSLAFLSGITSNPSPELSLAAYDTSTGVALWRAEHIYTGLEHDQDLAVSEDGQFVYARSRINNDQVIFARDASDGQVIWSQVLPDFLKPSSESAITGYADIAVSHSGDAVYVCYRVASAAGSGTASDSDMAVYALDSASGAVRWERALDLGVSRNIPHALEVTQDDASVIVAGRVREALTPTGTLLTPHMAVTIALDAQSGADEWIARYSDSIYRWATAIRFSDDGQVVFVLVNGFSESAPSDQLVVAYSRATGSELWSSTPVVGVGAYDMQLSLDGDTVLVTGASHATVSSAGTKDFVTVAYASSSGAQVWRSEFDSGREDISSSIAIGADGNTAFISGSAGLNSPLGFLTSDLTDADGFQTIAYDIDSGAEVWRSSFGLSSIAGGGPIGIGIGSSDTRLFVAGNDEVSDFALFAYDIPTLVTDKESISLAGGGTSSFGLRPGLGSEGDFYFVLGSASGSSPGIDLGGGLVLPLQIDAYFNLTLNPQFSAGAGFQGNLDAKGLASAALTVPPGLDPALAGITLNHAFVAAEQLGVPNAVSNAVQIQLNP